MRVPKISIGTWVRTILLLVTLINALLAMAGKAALPITEDDVNKIIDTGYAFYSVLAVAFAAALAWWKDNAFTKKARIEKEQAKRK
jgi:SPP1 family holin